MNLAQPINFAALMEPVALRLLGEPNARLSKPPRDVRFGTHGSMSVDYETGRFFDHENNVGGGVLDFIKNKMGCDHGGAAAWLRAQGLLPGSTPRPPPKPKLTPVADPGSNIIAEYDYMDETGKPLFQTVRYEPKRFSQRRPDGNGGWISNIDGVRRVLYRLPDLIQAVADGRTIFVVEGEKDCINLRALGFAATTNPMGANKWLPEYSEFLRGADVVIIGDNNEPGRKHVEQVTNALLGIVKRLRVLDLVAVWPECPDKGDISNWLEAGGTADKLSALVEALPTKSQPAPPADSWPVMDEKAFHGIAGEFVRALDPHTEADPAGLLIQFQVSFGNVIGRGPFLLIESSRHSANINVLHVGKSSKSRKGTGAGRIEEVFQHADSDWSRDRIVSGLSSGEGFIDRVRDEVKKYNVKEKCFEVVDPGVKDKRLLVIEPEFAGALVAMDRQGNTLSPHIRNAWDGKILQTLTRASPLKATGAHISIAGHITVDELRARLTRTDMCNGFANRFLFFLVKRSKFLPHGGHFPQGEAEKFGKRIAEIIEAAKKIGRVTMTVEAAAAWEASYPELSADRPGLLGAVTARAEAQVIRLALIYALADKASEIDTVHLEAAMAVWAYSDASAQLIFGDSTGDPVADDILTALRRSRAGMTRTDLSNLFGRNRPAGQIGAALALLLKLGLAKFETEHTAGRPVETWFARGGPR